MAHTIGPMSQNGYLIEDGLKMGWEMGKLFISTSLKHNAEVLVLKMQSQAQSSFCRTASQD
ncbi:MAG: hypothetical protein BA864_06565 [Desulfuromonadales bacterium C00003093]|nr:MAG: hypothetical protein BA864_06565 [Desulfuromonadales bacterium C00003093]